MSRLYEVPAEFAAGSRHRLEDYRRLYAESVRDPEGFWDRMGRRLDWVRPYTRVRDVSYDPSDFRIQRIPPRLTRRAVVIVPPHRMPPVERPDRAGHPLPPHAAAPPTGRTRLPRGRLHRLVPGEIRVQATRHPHVGLVFQRDLDGIPTRRLVGGPASARQFRF